MKRTKEDYHALLDETVAYYSEDTSRRASDNEGNCHYYEDGRMCAVGRCLEDSEKVQREFFGRTATNINNRIGIDSLLKDEYKGYNPVFWQRLQSLHDGKEYWDNEGVSYIGGFKIGSIKKDIDKGKFCD